MLEPAPWRRAFLATAIVDDEVGARQAFEKAELTPLPSEIARLSRREIDPEPEDGKRRAAAKVTARRFLESLADDEQARSALGVNEHEEVEWFDQDRYRVLVSAITSRMLAAAKTKKSRDRVGKILSALAELEAASEYRWDYLTAGRPAKPAKTSTSSGDRDETAPSPSTSVGAEPGPVESAGDTAT